MTRFPAMMRIARIARRHGFLSFSERPAPACWLRVGMMGVVLLMASTAAAAVATAQPTRSTQPATPRSGSDSGTTSYDVGGIRVIHRYVTANEVVAANIYLLEIGRAHV